MKCGSPGEVANDPLMGNLYYFGKQRYKQVASYGQQEMLKPYRLRQNAIQKQMIHTMLALHAPDQLRQRVAWALAQVLVIALFDSSVLGDHSEVWTSYYDIFVRNAFGCYRDIMREVAFNPIMGCADAPGARTHAIHGFLTPRTWQALPDLPKLRVVCLLFNAARRELCARDDAALLHRPLDPPRRRHTSAR